LFGSDVEALSEFKKVTVLGAGLMGHGIAQVAAQVSKYDVIIYDLNQKLLENGMKMIRDSLQRFTERGMITKTEKQNILERIIGTLDLKEAVSTSDLVIEAIVENADEKMALLRKVSGLIPENAIVTTNTSFISITKLASAMERPENFCGFHFFNPPQLMKLVEVVKGERTSTETINAVLGVARSMGKESILVQKDCPGFIVNRILLPALREAANIYFDGVASRDDVDKAIRLALSWPMGPLMLIDYIGVDTVLAMKQVLEQDTNNDIKNNNKWTQMVETKLLGRKTGRGFYEWREGKAVFET
jgi:3-hydroxyacyl-CoA dehydrogenase